jgi:hypothetical protein
MAFSSSASQASGESIGDADIERDRQKPNHNKKLRFCPAFP